ncbi:hypothetical protein HDU86_006088 [Geranomyces michiganensis]|nr:hypothetical protein HDU86_006088 [Geranomyces michiganensis]
MSDPEPTTLAEPTTDEPVSNSTPAADVQNWAPEGEATVSKDTQPLTLSVSSAPPPQDPLISAAALDSGVHANAEPELDVRFIAPTGTSNAIVEPPPIAPEPAEEDKPQQKDGLDTHADGSMFNHEAGMQADEGISEPQPSENDKDASAAESGAEPDEGSGEALPILLKPGWKMELDVSAILNRKNTTDPYITACKQLHLVPVTFILQRLQSTEIIMPHHGLGPSGAEALAKVLGNNSTLRELDLTNNAIEAGGAALGRALQINRTHNKIGDLGAIALGAGVGGNDGLRELNLAWNCIRHKGVAGFLAGLKDNAVLTKLNLEASGIGDTGQSVASFLARNSSIQALNLRRTRLGDASLISISKALEQNYSIRELDLSDNPWSNNAALPLFKCLLNSSGITKLLMRNIKLTKDIRPKIDELLAEKTDLEIIEVSEADELIAEKEKRTGYGLSRGSKEDETSLETDREE